jgi:predicted transcriptional regulator
MTVKQYKVAEQLTVEQLVKKLQKMDQKKTIAVIAMGETRKHCASHNPLVDVVEYENEVQLERAVV